MHRMMPLGRTAWAVLLSTAFAGCAQQPGSAAADVPATDVRQIPEYRKAMVPDLIMQAADAGRILGQRTAPVTLMVVSDYQCAECRTWSEQVLPVIRSAYVDPGKARLIWVHYPLRVHPNAVHAASAALCASAQGKFWEASARLFARQPLWGGAKDADVVIDSLAAAPGIDAFALHNCIESKRMLRQVRGDIDWTDTARAGAPLTVVLGKRLVPASAGVAALRAAIDSALAAAPPVVK